MLLNEFSVIFDRPEKVKKLREYILSLAVRGKLVEQDENDEPASVLLERIREEKDRLVKEKKIKKEKSLPEISEEEIPYELPKGWVWVRLGDLGITQTGTTPSTKNPEYFGGNIPFIKPADISGNGIVYNNESLTELGLKKGRLIESNSVLMVCIGGSIGKNYFIDRDCSCNQQINSITGLCGINNKFLHYFVSSNEFYEQIISTATGSATPIINKSKWEQLLVQVPPLNEQNKIVEKVDYLMKFCDNLEAQLEKRVKYGSLSAKSVLNGVSNCSSYEQLEESLRFIIDNFKDLTLSDGAVKELKNAILSLAVRGKLVPQDESDEPASVLVDRIREDKESLVKEKMIKKEKSLPEIDDAERLFDIPKNWIWDRLPNITIFQEGPGILAKDFRERGIPLIRLSGMKTNVVSLEGCNYLDEEMVSKKWAHFKLDIGDIVVSSSASMGKVAIVDETTVGCIPYTGLIRFKMLGGLNDKYFIYFMQSPEYIGQINTQKSGTTIKHYGPTHLKKMIIPLPPVNEQKRIVEKVEKLMQLCDELELRIEKSKKYSEKLMESILKNNLKA